MIIRVAAQSKDLIVSLFAPIRAKQAMRCIKMGLSEYGYFHDGQK